MMRMNTTLRWCVLRGSFGLNGLEEEGGGKGEQNKERRKTNSTRMTIMKKTMTPSSQALQGDWI